ncbi:GntR family transcriptional regulator [Candidatus Protofrankia californiensis]|uniref:GntR family transcriptional regulator n=1 Tax=Candidatus Protofrankia californiensis TaxID=1839754 RepID=A0A1C3P6R1_9ACTN|nr:GntR family transcriptional regulator [Candidatus Protofrankia californiensis]
MVLLNAAGIATDGPVGIGERGGVRAPDLPADLPPGVRDNGTGRPPAGDGRIGRQVRVPKTAELVAARLRRQIVRGELVEGDALPPEAVLMEQFGVSRPTLREAFRVLESEALISVRRGAHGGARVHTPNGDVAARYAALVLEYRGTTLADVHQARVLLEPSCVRQLAQRRTDKDLARLRVALSSIEAATAGAGRPAGVREARVPGASRAAVAGFHSLLVELAGNQTLVVLAGMLRHIIGMAHEDGLTADTDLTQTGIPEAGDDVHDPYRRLVALIEAGAADEAEGLWRRHLLATIPSPGRDPATVFALQAQVPGSPED